MANKSVSILTPNGRRQNVKVTPNTTILQILEEVCKKQGFKPEEYDLKHHNIILDTTTIIRFSGLPNNAQLEMCSAQKARTESAVVLGIQLENGSRLMGNFFPADDLLKVVNNLCPEEMNRGDNLVLIYMRTEVFGEALQKTTLRSLGLTGGRAMIRLIHRNPEELKTQANVSAPLPSKPVEEKPYVRKMKDSSPEGKKICPSSAQEKNNFVTDFLTKEKERKKSEGEPMEVEDVPQMKQETVKETIIAKNKGKGKCKTRPTEEIKTEDFVYLGERNAMAFSLEMASAVPHEDLPDEFFELTIQDVRKLFNDLKEKRLQLEENPLQTTAMRNLEESKRVLRHINQYKKSVIRVQFPDRTVLQGTFKPLETVHHVLQFVREFLQNAQMEFYLYTTPPKCVLEPTMSLVDAQCVPSALVHFGTNNSTEEPARGYLREDIFSKFVAPSTASVAATTLMVKERRAVPNEEKPDITVDDDVNVGASTSKDVPIPAKDEPKSKVPKWFKTNK